MEIVAFDLETTGLSPRTDRIVEFSFHVLDRQFAEQHVITRTVHPGTQIPEDAIDIHGITNEAVHDKPFFDVYAPAIQELIDGATVMAYNASFDVPFLHYELRDAGQQGFAVHPPVIDPLHIFRNRFNTSYALPEAVSDFCNASISDAHRAAADVRAMIRVFKEQLRQLAPDMTLEDVLLHEGVLHG